MRTATMLLNVIFDAKNSCKKNQLSDDQLSKKHYLHYMHRGDGTLFSITIFALSQYFTFCFTSDHTEQKMDGNQPNKFTPEQKLFCVLSKVRGLYSPQIQSQFILKWPGQQHPDRRSILSQINIMKLIISMKYLLCYELNSNKYYNVAVFI